MHNKHFIFYFDLHSIGKKIKRKKKQKGGFLNRDDFAYAG